MKVKFNIIKHINNKIKKIEKDFVPIMGHIEYYKNKNDILSEKEIEDYIKNYEDYPEEQEYINKYYQEINSRNKIKGTWIKIQP